MATLKFSQVIDLAWFCHLDNIPDDGVTFSSTYIATNWQSYHIDLHGDFSAVHGGDGVTITGDFDRYIIEKSGRAAVELTNLGADFKAFDDIGSSRGGEAGLAYLLRGNDRVVGSAGGDDLTGGDGNDTISGNNGNDWLSGDDGRDTLTGGSGADALVGGEGSDKLTGGAGGDVFQFNDAEDSSAGQWRDTITDFGRGDTIDLGHLARRALDFIGRDGFSHHAGEVRQAGWIIEVDLDGDGRADVSVKVEGAGNLQADDFIL